MAHNDRPLQYVADDPDLPLVQEIRNGNTSAFEELVKRYDRRLYRIALNIVHNHEDAQDVVQEALFKAFSKLTLFQGKSKFSTWLIRIVLNQALMKTRRVRRTFLSIDHNSYEGEEHVPREIVDWAPNPEAAYRNSELRTILQLSLRKL
jgi:RNA polymerase sigma-70 factor, ECF subfamily